MEKKETLSLKELGIQFKKTKDEQIYAQLFKRVKSGATNYIFNIVKDRSIAQDIFTEAMLNVYLKIDQYNPKYHISTWIYRICYNHACYYLRGLKSRGTTISFSTIDYEGENSSILDKIEYQYLEQNETSDALEAEEEQKWIESTLIKSFKKMDMEYRVILVEKYFNSLKNEEIADKLKLPLHTVKNRLNRGKVLLKRTLEGTGIERYI